MRFGVSKLPFFPFVSCQKRFSVCELRSSKNNKILTKKCFGNIELCTISDFPLLKSEAANSSMFHLHRVLTKARLPCSPHTGTFLQSHIWQNPMFTSLGIIPYILSVAPSSIVASTWAGKHRFSAFLSELSGWKKIRKCIKEETWRKSQEWG